MPGRKPKSERQAEVASIKLLAAELTDLRAEFVEFKRASEVRFATHVRESDAEFKRLRDLVWRLDMESTGLVDPPVQEPFDDDSLVT